MNTLPLISVIIPLYNKEKVIKRTIQSVLDQSFKDYEILVINDGSTDDSFKKVSEILDDRLQVFTKPNGGVSDARNYGIGKAKSELIFFLDADDYITSDCLKHFIRLTQTYKDESVFVSNFKIVRQDSESIFCSGRNERLINKPLKALWTREIFPRTGAMVIKKECFVKVGHFRTDISVFEDLEFLIRLLNNYTLVYTPMVLLFYHTDSNSLSKMVIPINKEYAYYANLNATDIFERLILAEMVYGAYTRRIEIKDSTSVQHLKQSLKKHFFLVFTAYYCRKILILRDKINNSNFIKDVDKWIKGRKESKKTSSVHDYLH